MPIVTDEGGPKSRFSKEVTKLFKKEFVWQEWTQTISVCHNETVGCARGIGGEALLVFGFKDNLPLEKPVRYRQNTEIAWINYCTMGNLFPRKQTTIRIQRPTEMLNSTKQKIFSHP